MLEFPDFSVSMCVYCGDHADHFAAALESVVNQTVPPNEIVLTVDGPIPDGIEAVIAKYRSTLADTDIVFRTVYLEQNMGHGEARRVCFENCSFDLIALMDADDLSVPNRFEKQLSFLSQHPEITVLGGYIQEFINDTKHFVGRRLVPENDRAIKEYMKKRCPMNQMTVMFKKQDIQAVGGYQDWYCDEDYYLWIRLAFAGYQFGNIPEDLVYVRVGEEMYNRRGGIRYFRSEAKIQRYMYKNRMIGMLRFTVNIAERLILQVLMPNKLRGYIFQKMARS